MRYRPGEAIRWLELGAKDLRKSAGRQGKSLISREGERNFPKDLRQAAGVLADLGKGAFIDLMHRQAEASEYILHDDRFEISSPARIRSIGYDEVTDIRMRGDRATFVLKQGSITIKPHAHIVSGRVKVPIGFARNGIEVPFETLIDELSARCGVEIERED